MQALPAGPTAVAVAEMNERLYLHIGLENGVLLRTVMDNVTGVITGGLTDSRSKFIGHERISLSKIFLQGQ